MMAKINIIFLSFEIQFLIQRTLSELVRLKTLSCPVWRRGREATSPLCSSPRRGSRHFWEPMAQSCQGRVIQGVREKFIEHNGGHKHQNGFPREVIDA